MSKVKEYTKFNFKIDVNLEELIYYMHWADGQRFRKDIFNEERFTRDYVSGKFRDFQDNFPYFLSSLSDTYKTRFCVAVHNFYMNNHKEK